MIMVKNVYPEHVCLNGIKGSKIGTESVIEKIVGENNVGCFFMLQTQLCE
jgi:hypothetical protein